MAAPSVSWRWLPRAVEDDLAQLICTQQASGLPTWLYIRGRRRTGKTQTIQRVLRALLGEPGRPWRYTTVTADNLDSLRVVVGEAASLREAVQVLKERIVAGTIVVLDEIQEASLSLQQLLQAAVDDVEGLVLHGRRVTGGLVIMGSRTATVEAIATGTRAPLFHRMTAHRTILPFLPYEMDKLFDRFGITSALQKVYILLMTGSYPAVLAKLCAQHLLANNSNVKDMLHALVRSDKGLVDFMESDEFDESWLKVAELAVRHKGSDVDLVQAVMKQGMTFGVASAKLRHLEERYGVIQRVLPLAPALRPRRRVQVYEIVDPRWLWYHQLFHPKDSVATGGHVQDIGIAKVTDAHVQKFHTAAGRFMESQVKEAIRVRQRRSCNPLPAWRWDGEAGGTRKTWADDHGMIKSAPIVLAGKPMAMDAELDGVCLFAEEQHVVFLSCKLSPAALKEEATPKKEVKDPCAFITRTHHHANTFITALHDHGTRGSAAGAGGELGSAVEGMEEDRDGDMCAIASAIPKAFAAGRVSFIYVACGLNDEPDCAAALWERIPAAHRTNVYLADFNDMWDFHPQHEHGEPEGVARVSPSPSTLGSGDDRRGNVGAFWTVCTMAVALLLSLSHA